MKSFLNRPYILMMLGAILAAAIFSVDLMMSLGVAGGVPYVVVVFLGLWVQDKRYILVSAIAGSALTTAGFLWSPPGGDLWHVAANRLIALFAIWVTAVLCLKYREKAESALSQTQEEFRSVFDHAMDGILKIDETGIVRSFNPSAERIFGFKAEEIIGKNVNLLMPEPYKSEHDGYIRRYLNTGETHILGMAREVLGQCKDGSVFPLEISVSEFFREDQRMFVGIVRDISERKRAEAEISNLSKFPAENPYPVLRIAHNGTILYGNAAAQRLLMKQWNRMIGQAVPEQWQEWIARAVAENVTEQVEIAVYDAIFSLAVTPIAKTGYVNIYGQDITDRKRAEENAQFLYRQIELVLASAGEGIFGLDLQGTLTFVNPAAKRMLGYKVGELPGKPVNILLQDPNVPKQEPVSSEGCPILAVLENSLSFRVTDSVFWRKNGTSFPVEYISTSLMDRGEITGAVVTFSNITERLKTEKELKRQAADLEKVNAELKDFTRTASHDLQEPLRKIVTFSDRLESALTEGKEANVPVYLERIQTSALRMKQLIEDLLEFSKVTAQPDEFKSVDLNRVVEGVLSDLEIQIEQSKGRVEVAPLPTLEANGLQMRLLFQNLISNGLKYTSPERPPTVSIKSILLPNGNWNILVTDNGIGIEKQYRERIFKPFARLHSSGEYRGSGMGLAICSKIVSRHKGSIAIEDTAGEGTCFVVTLPQTQEI
ncbi:MAG: PAS domain S-box protein [Nitrospinales bacterium]